MPNKVSFPPNPFEQLFESFDENNVGWVDKAQLLAILKKRGIEADDPRIQETVLAFDAYPDGKITSLKDFKQAVEQNIAFMTKIINADLIIPNFEDFTQDIAKIYEDVKPIKTGDVASYIPQLKRVDPEKFAIAISTVDGQRYSIGDASDPFVVQSTCKPILYCLALEEHGESVVHRHVGREPSGMGFNEITLNKNNLPHNPMINAGAIMTSALLLSKKNLAQSFDYLMNKIAAMSGGKQPGFNNPVYLSEKQTADRNFAIGYFMQEKKVFPENIKLHEVLDFYFQTCSIEMTAQSMSMLAATLANSGICPLTNEKVLKPDTTKNCLSLMHSCGMYDFSGEFAFTVGLPAKSGVSGVIMVVVPNVMGLCVWSPNVDKLGNSVRGVRVCKQLVETFNFHHYDDLLHEHTKKDPRQHKQEMRQNLDVALCWAASQGDVNELKRLVVLGADLDEADYDGRTAAHLAASNGQLRVIQYLTHKKINLNPVDRWGNTPLDDALAGSHKEIVKLLKEHGALKGKALR